LVKRKGLDWKGLSKFFQALRKRLALGTKFKVRFFLGVPPGLLDQRFKFLGFYPWKVVLTKKLGTFSFGGPIQTGLGKGSLPKNVF